MEKPIVFLSCGQRHQRELELGRQLYNVITDCGYEAFFAQRRSDLRGLSEVIFDTLAKSSAYIAVLHRREALDNGKYRASVFIEQELAIAAFIRRSRSLPVLFYAERGIERSGVRDTLLLNTSFPDREVFDDDSEVLEHVRAELPRISIAPVARTGVAIGLDVRSRWSTDGSPTMTVQVWARNLGTTLPGKMELRIWIPAEFQLPVNLPSLQSSDSSDEFRRIVRDVAGNTLSLDPEEPTLIYAFPLFTVRGLAEKVFRFRLVAEGQTPEQITRTYAELWKDADERQRGGT